MMLGKVSWGSGGQEARRILGAPPVQMTQAGAGHALAEQLVALARDRGRNGTHVGIDQGEARQKVVCADRWPWITLAGGGSLMLVERSDWKPHTTLSYGRGVRSIESGPLRRAAAATDHIDRGSWVRLGILHFSSVA